MRAKKSIFGSKSERLQFDRLQKTFGVAFRVFTNLPFSSLIDINPLEVDKNELAFARKTSIDVVICTKDEAKPILAIEFYGLTQSFTKATGLQPWKRVDRLRELKLNFKVRAFAKAGIPFIVVSYPEEEKVSNAANLTLTDAIVGQLLSQRELWNSIRANPDITREKQNSVLMGAQTRLNPVLAQASKLVSQAIVERRLFIPSDNDSFELAHKIGQSVREGSYPVELIADFAKRNPKIDLSAGFIWTFEDYEIPCSDTPEEVISSDRRVPFQHEIGHRFELVTTLGIISKSCILRDVGVSQPSEAPENSLHVSERKDGTPVLIIEGYVIDTREIAFVAAQLKALEAFFSMVAHRAS